MAPYSVIGRVPLLWQIGTHLVILVPVITETLFAIRPVSEYNASWTYFNATMFVYIMA